MQHLEVNSYGHRSPPAVCLGQNHCRSRQLPCLDSYPSAGPPRPLGTLTHHTWSVCLEIE